MAMLYQRVYNGDSARFGKLREFRHGVLRHVFGRCGDTHKDCSFPFSFHFQRSSLPGEFRLKGPNKALAIHVELPRPEWGKDFPVFTIFPFWKEVGGMDSLGPAVLIHRDGGYEV